MGFIRKIGTFSDLSAIPSEPNRTAIFITDRLLNKKNAYLDVSCDTKKPSFVEDTRQGVAVEYVSCGPSENLKELFPEQYGEEYEVPEDEETEQA